MVRAPARKALRVHFTAADLARTTVATGHDAVWELVLSVQRLQHRHPVGSRLAPIPGEILDWRSNVVTNLAGQSLGHTVRDHLLPLLPLSTYLPDFLTPHNAEPGFGGFPTGIDTVLSTPRLRIAHELDRLTTRSGAPSWGAELATGDQAALRVLHETTQSYFATAIAPYRAHIEQRVAMEATRLAGIHRHHPRHHHRGDPTTDRDLPTADLPACRRAPRQQPRRRGPPRRPALLLAHPAGRDPHRGRLELGPIGPVSENSTPLRGVSRLGDRPVSSTKSLWRCGWS